MISINKFINSSLKTSNNILNDIFIPINKRIGFINGPSPIIPIYFYRYIGISENETEYYKALSILHEKLSALDDLYLNFVCNIPFKTDKLLISHIENIWSSNFEQTFDKFYVKKLIHLLKEHKLLLTLKTSLLNSSVEESFKHTLDLYLKKEPNLNSTKIKNFILKILTWTNCFVPNLVKNFTLKNLDELINPKVVYFGDIKKHEIYFLFFLSKLGCDVLYINSPNDCDFSYIDNNENYSKSFLLPNKCNLNKDKLPKTHIKNKQFNYIEPITSNIKRQGQDLKTKKFNLNFYCDSITASLKSSNDIINDFTIPLNKRNGFINKPLPIVPIYFYRYIGIGENKDVYYNNLYKLDKKLTSLNSLYIKFTSELPINSDPNLMEKTNSIWQSLSNFNKIKKNTLMELLIEQDVFLNPKDNILYCSIIKGFYTTLSLYLDNEDNITTAKVKNFSLKIIMWIHKYVSYLFKESNYLNNLNHKILNPKIIYYGNIKKHDAYFLIFLSLLGCDVLYINSYNDETFEKIDKNNVYSKVITLKDKTPLKEFPKEEILIRQETTAFKASKEIGEILYDEDAGLFKPWQFENYKTNPITLKTTYDEFKLLWKEETRMRQGFKIENKTVYIPNLFAKISGTHRDIKTYWNELKELKNVKDLLFISEVPYVKTSYSNYDFYSLQYCFTKDNLLDSKKLFSHRLYKFAYLKTSLQNTIVEKINQMLKLSFFKGLDKNDTEFKLKILITVLSIDKNVLELIQKFDYPFNIPKIMFYDNTENIFSLQDCIILIFLNLIGFDIAIFTPTGYNNIEQRIHEKYYDIHKLENVNFNLQIPNNIASISKNKSGSFWWNLFK